MKLPLLVCDLCRIEGYTIAQRCNKLHVCHAQPARENHDVVRIEDIMDRHMLPYQDQAVDRPIHYTSGSVECIDAIEAALSLEEFKGYLRGNVMKYLWRFRRKGGGQDLDKGSWYLDRLRKMVGKAA